MATLSLKFKAADPQEETKPKRWRNPGEGRKVYMVWHEGEGPPVVFHKTKQAAMGAAWALSEKMPNKRFHVLGTRTVCVNEVPVE